MSLKHDLTKIASDLRAARTKCLPSQLAGFDVAVSVIGGTYKAMRPSIDLGMFLRNAGIPAA